MLRTAERRVLDLGRRLVVQLVGQEVRRDTVSDLPLGNVRPDREHFARHVGARDEVLRVPLKDGR